MLIAGCLLILVMLSLFSVILGSAFFGIISELTINNVAIINGSATTFVIGTQEFFVNIDPIVGMIDNIIIWCSIALLIGIQAFGSGLSDEAVRIGSLSIIYTAIWTLLSTLAIPLLFAIELFGALIYVTLTIAYTVGVIQKIAGGGSN